MLKSFIVCGTMTHSLLVLRQNMERKLKATHNAYKVIKDVIRCVPRTPTEAICMYSGPHEDCAFTFIGFSRIKHRLRVMWCNLCKGTHKLNYCTINSYCCFFVNISSKLNTEINSNLKIESKLYKQLKLLTFLQKSSFIYKNLLYMYWYYTVLFQNH